MLVKNLNRIVDSGSNSIYLEKSDNISMGSSKLGSRGRKITWDINGRRVYSRDYSKSRNISPSIGMHLIPKAQILGKASNHSNFSKERTHSKSVSNRCSSRMTHNDELLNVMPNSHMLSSDSNLYSPTVQFYRDNMRYKPTGPTRGDEVLERLQQKYS